MRRSPILLLIVVAMLMALTAPASARGAIQISGDGVVLEVPDQPPAECPEDSGITSLFTLELTAGSLVGCWYTDEFTYFQENPSGTVSERGLETFVGEYYDDEGNLVGSGQFSTTYHFTGKFDDVGEIFGRCQHPIVEGSGSDVFEGVTGRVDFKDVDPANGILEYRGHVKFPNSG